MAYTSDLLNTLSERGYIHQLTDAAGLRMTWRGGSALAAAAVNALAGPLEG